jgi:Flp pilus assembly protein TadG
MSTKRPPSRPSRGSKRDGRGQALVEFSLAIVAFLLLLMAIFDLGRGIYAYNGVAQAARELARATSVHPGVVLGESDESRSVLATQHGLVPLLGDPTYTCVDIAGAVTGHSPCRSGDFVRVTISASYDPVTPLLGLIGPFTLSSSSSLEIHE